MVKTTEVSRIVTERTGKSISRQRIAQLLNAVNITEKTLSTIAEGLGVDLDELTRWKEGD